MKIIVPPEKVPEIKRLCELILEFNKMAKLNDCPQMSLILDNEKNNHFLREWEDD